MNPCKCCSFSFLHLSEAFQSIRLKPLKNLDTFIFIQLSKTGIHQQRHNPFAYMTYIYSILSLQCIIRRFSNRGVFGCFVSRERLCCHGLVHTSGDNANQNQSSCCFSFNLLCEWVFDRFHQKIEVIGQISRWEWGMETPCLGARSGTLNKTIVARHPLGSSLGVDAKDWKQNTTLHFLHNIVNWIINDIFHFSWIFGLQTSTVIMSDQDKLLLIKS